jgi:ubiquinone/menaquinone biosynthesis C-methylase UbiE
MTSRDIYQALNDQSAETMEMVIARMEARAKDPRFVEMRGAYLDSLDLASARTFLDLGCGTGLDARAAARHPAFKGVATGVDVSDVMVEAGIRFALDEGIADRVFLRTGDAEKTGLPDASFDVIVMHTLVSHVKDPGAVMSEASRLLSPRGRLLVFDADFDSIAFAYPDAAVARAVEASLLETFVANPRVMRELPSLLAEAGVDIAGTRSHIVSDVGTTAFFTAFVNNYAPRMSTFGLQPAATVDAWISHQKRAIENGTFFGSLNFHAYLLSKPR